MQDLSPTGIYNFAKNKANKLKKPFCSFYFNEISGYTQLTNRYKFDQAEGGTHCRLES